MAFMIDCNYDCLSGGEAARSDRISILLHWDKINLEKVFPKTLRSFIRVLHEKHLNCLQIQDHVTATWNATRSPFSISINFQTVSIIILFGHVRWIDTHLEIWRPIWVSTRRTRMTTCKWEYNKSREQYLVHCTYFPMAHKFSMSSRWCLTRRAKSSLVEKNPWNKDGTCRRVVTRRWIDS